LVEKSIFGTWPNTELLQKNLPVEQNRIFSKNNGTSDIDNAAGFKEHTD